MRITGIFFLVLSALIVAVNAAGFVIPLRADNVDGYVDFANSRTQSFETSLERLRALSKPTIEPTELVTEATRVFHEGMAHIAPEDVIEHGLDHYRMTVPITENWILFALSFLKPDTYSDYEFCHYQRALERGTGRCGQQSMALVSFLANQGLETGFVALEGHAIATAKVDDGSWYLLDADYGAVIPFDLAQAEQNPESVIPHYWSQAAIDNEIHELYAPKNRLKYGGPEARYARACPIENIAYLLKWLTPFILLAFGLLLLRERRQT